MTRHKIKTITAILIAATMAWAQDIEQFVFEITTTAANQTFAIPLSGQLNQTGTAANYTKAYNWTIDWGDGSGNQNASGTQPNNASPGIAHEYTEAGTYTITIKPAGSTDAWFGAFGFEFDTNGANAQANKNMVTKVNSPLTPLMTRSAEQISNGTAPAYGEWRQTFYNCQNLTMGEAFTFSESWNSIWTVGNSFAHDMFSRVTGSSFTMNEVFNLPQGITTVGSNFAYYMFYSVSGSSFNMNSVFNLPQGITAVGDHFARYMFQDVTGSSFTMNEVFNLPQGITTMGTYFAAYMFSGVSGSSFTMNEVFNLPQEITAVGDRFANYMFSGVSGSSFTMNEVFNLPQGITTMGTYFAYSMFQNVSGSSFNMNSVFNLPQGITTVGSNFATDMFNGVTGSSFNMNSVFNLPQGITTVGSYFATNMFNGVTGSSFKVNDVFKFPALSQTELNKFDVFYRTFYNSSAISNAAQTRTAASIINGNPPGGNRQTFTNNNRFLDRNYIATQWGGGGNTAAVITMNIHPAATTNFIFGNIFGNLSADASIIIALPIAYQWYSNTENSNEGGALIEEATSKTFEIPADLNVGTHYFYCVASTNDGAYAVTSKVATVSVAAIECPEGEELIGEECKTKTYTIKWVVDGEIVRTDENVEHGSTIEAPPDPTKEGFTFRDWIKNILGELWNFLTDTVESNVTLTATWEENSSSSKDTSSSSSSEDASSSSSEDASSSSSEDASSSSSSEDTSSSSSEDTPSSSSSEEQPSSSSSDDTSSSSSNEDASSSSSSSSDGTSSSSAGATPILNSQFSILNSPTPLYYNLKGEPLGTTKPVIPGVYIEKQGKQIKRIVVR